MFRILLCLVFFATSARAVEDFPVKRVSGEYTLAKIEAKPESVTRLTFKANEKDQPFTEIYIDTLSPHKNLKGGSTMRLSASIYRIEERQGSSVGVIAQLLLHVPSARGVTPIWIISKETGALDLGSARFLEMGLPLSEYQVL